MQRFLRLFICLFLLFPQTAFPQTADSPLKQTDANARAIHPTEKEIQRWKDSLERERIFRNLEQHGQPLDEFLKEMREAEEKRKRQVYIRIGLGVVFLLLVITRFIRRRRQG